ncbi:MAG TPA: histidine phosphatase family protein [Burkholderiales bacterium]|nr:histidine phosphatase family protein [Burkholderiales bacterium]
MQLILWRHAEAPSGYPDSERSLSPAGRHQAEAMAAWLRAHLPDAYGMIVSPAARAQQTASALSGDFHTDEAVGTAATPEQVLQRVGWPHGEETVIVVGHQPTLGAVAALALTGKSHGWPMSTGSIWWLARAEHGRETVVRAALGPDLL